MLIALNDIAVIIKPPKCSQLERGREGDNSSSVCSDVSASEQENECSALRFDGWLKPFWATARVRGRGRVRARVRAMSTLFASQ